MKTPWLTSIIALLIATAAPPPLPAAAAALPAELLEKGIYAQDTKGDLDAAIAIYQQLTAEAKTSQALAAQAQFRLGQCLLKKNRAQEAMAAFERLIRDFPSEAELIAQARQHLPGELALRAVPWKDGERLQLTLVLPAGLEIGAMELRADLVEVEGRKAWRVGRRMGGGGGEMLSVVDVDPETFVPFTSFWKHTLLGEVTAAFKPGEVTLQRPEAAEPTMLRPEKTIFDNEEVMHLMRRLPLEVGYKTNLPVITTLGGGTILPIGLEVPAKEEVEVPAGKFDCFKVALSVGQTFWISDTPERYLVKFEGGGATGNLATITRRAAGASVSFGDTELGISFTAPPEWVIHRQNRGAKGAILHLLDAAADASNVTVKLSPTESLPAAARQSSRAFAEHGSNQSKMKDHGIKVRPESWATCAVAGRPAVSFISDYEENNRQMVLLTLNSVGPQTSETFVLACAADKFDALRAAFDAILASYRRTK